MLQQTMASMHLSLFVSYLSSDFARWWFLSRGMYVIWTIVLLHVDSLFFFHPWFKFSCTLFIAEMYNIFCGARMFGRVTNYMAKYFDFCTNSIKKAHFCGELSQTKWDVWWWCWWKLIIYSSCRIEQFVVDCDARGPTRNNFRCWIHLGLEKNSIFTLSNGNPSNCIHPQLLQSYTMASDDATKTPQVWIDNRRKNDPNLF